MRTRHVAPLAAALTFALALALTGAANASPSARQGETAGPGPGLALQGGPRDHPLTLDATGHARGYPARKAASARTTRTEAAHVALARARTVFSASSSTAARSGPVRGKDATTVLLDLRRHLGYLSGDARRQANAILARPTGGGDPTGGLEHGYNTTKVRTACHHVCVHWVDPLDFGPNGNKDAVARAKTGDTGPVPVWVQKNIHALNTVWDTEITKMGYQQPLSDASSPEHGPDGKLDVYLENLPSGFYGYCTTDDPTYDSSAFGVKTSAYCVLDKDFEGFQLSPLKSLEVTAAHEFFHAIQFSYDINEDTWLMEGTAAWMEDEVFDSVNDNLQYLGQSALSYPELPIDFYSDSYLPYGSWLFWKFLSDDLAPGQSATDPSVIRDIWTQAAKPGQFSIDAVKSVLASRGTTFTKAFRTFGVWNRIPGKRYTEGSLYPRAYLSKVLTLTRKHPRTATYEVPMYHLSNRFIQLVPGPTLHGSRRLTVHLNLAPLYRGSAAALTVHKKGGAASVVPFRLNSLGNGSATVGFSRRQVAYVDLSLTNASTRYTCETDQVFSCQGSPKDDTVKDYFSAKAIR